MPALLILLDDRLLPAEPSTRGVVRELYGEVKGLPILSPHGHTDPEWFAGSAAFSDAAERLATTERPHEALVHHHAIRDLACTLPKRAYKL